VTYKLRTAKVFVHVGDSWSEGRTYLIDRDLEIKIKINPRQWLTESYGFLRKESKAKGSSIKAVLRGKGFVYQEKYFQSSESRQAKRWLRDEVNKQIRSINNESTKVPSIRG
jgi:hypothetical protein